jgi:hypothetical protein
LKTPDDPDAWGTGRRSRLFPGPFLVHADLHNHTRFSDGAGDPALLFPSLQEAGLDVAAITDHSRWASAFLGLVHAPGWTGIDSTDWRQAAELADKFNADGDFVAMRGFEWSSATDGHMNVWGSQHFTDPLRSANSMHRWWRWLERDGRDGLVSFNHPGTGRRRFAGFTYRPAMAGRLVGLEVFNRADDYLFKDVDSGRRSPIVQCLDAGWRPGLLGVTDEHGADWGRPEGKGRAGLYVRDLSRSGVIEALAARRFFASRVKGLRLDAAVTAEDGERARMGTAVPHQRGAVWVELDIDLGRPWWGRPLNVQILRPDARPAGSAAVPAVADAREVRLPTPDEPLIAYEVDLDAAAGPWVLVRVCDPNEPADHRAPGEYADFGAAIAYASPFWLEPPDA